MQKLFGDLLKGRLKEDLNRVFTLNLMINKESYVKNKRGTVIGIMFFFKFIDLFKCMVLHMFSLGLKFDTLAYVCIVKRHWYPPIFGSSNRVKI